MKAVSEAISSPWRSEYLGRPMSALDGQIAPIAPHRLAVATRNVPESKGCGLEIVSPLKD